MIGYAHDHGMQAAIHAIGDGILDDVLAVYREVLERNPRADHRHGVVHCQITRPDQLNAFGELSLNAYVQPIFLDYDIRIVNDRVGEKRAKSSYNFKTLHDMGVHVSGGSDCPDVYKRQIRPVQPSRAALSDFCVHAVLCSARFYRNTGEMSSQGQPKKAPQR